MAQVAVAVGAGGMVNSENDVRVRRAIAPATHTTAQTGVGVDLRGYDAVSVVVNVGVVTDGTIDIVVQHSDDDGSSDAYATVAALDSAFTSFTAAADETIEIRRIRNVLAATNIPIKRWIRVNTVETVASAGYALSACVVLGNKRSSAGDNTV